MPLKTQDYIQIDTKGIGGAAEKHFTPMKFSGFLKYEDGIPL